MRRAMYDDGIPDDDEEDMKKEMAPVGNFATQIECKAFLAYKVTEEEQKRLKNSTTATLKS